MITDVKDMLPDRSRVTNKGDCGRLLVVGGGSGMAGAPCFAAEAAYRFGVGLVEVSTHDDNRIPIQILIPEAIASPWSGFDIKKTVGADAIALGVGMGKSNEAYSLVDRILSSLCRPAVIDADALNIMSENPELLGYLGESTVVTPHIKEFSRLTGKSIDEIKKDTVSSAVGFAVKYGTNIVLKDSVSVVALCDGTYRTVTSGDSTLSKGGSGDILTGMIGSLLAQGLPIGDAAYNAAHLHGLAGKAAGESCGQRSALARDVLNELRFK